MMHAREIAAAEANPRDPSFAQPGTSPGRAFNHIEYTERFTTRDAPRAIEFPSSQMH
jgi:hypothetical protein